MMSGKTNPPDAAAAAWPNQQNKPTSQEPEIGPNSLKRKASELSNVPGTNNAVIWSEVPPRMRDMVLQCYERARSSGKAKQTSGVEDFHGKKPAEPNMSGVEDFKGKKPAEPEAGSAAVHDQMTESWPEDETAWCNKLNQLSKEELKAFADHLDEEMRVLRAAIGHVHNKVPPKLIEFDILKK